MPHKKRTGNFEKKYGLPPEAKRVKVGGNG